MNKGGSPVDRIAHIQEVSNRVCGTAERLSLIVAAEVEGGNVHRGTD